MLVCIRFNFIKCVAIDDASFHADAEVDEAEAGGSAEAETEAAEPGPGSWTADVEPALGENDKQRFVKMECVAGPDRV